MTSIFYKIVADFGEIRKINGSGTDKVRIHTEGIDSGIVTVGKVSAPIRCGVAKLSLSSVPDGEMRVSVYSGTSLTELEPLSKTADRIAPRTPDAPLLKRLALRMEELELELADIKERVTKNERAIKGTSLFGEE